MKSKRAIAIFLLLIILILSGCNENNDKTPTELVFMKGLPTQIEMQVGEELNNRYIMYKGIVDFKNNNVIFFSSDENIVRVEVSTQEFPIYTYFDIIAVSEGEAIIFAQNVEGSVISEPIKITVIENPETQNESNSEIILETEEESDVEIESETESEIEVNTEIKTDADLDQNEETEDNLKIEQNAMTDTETVTVTETNTGVNINTENKSTSYVLNTDSKKFHFPSCSSAKRMKDENKKIFDGSRDEIISQGYTACKSCKP